MKASCQCGQLTAEVSATTDQIVACHCLACQRRTGAPFGVVAYYDEADVAIAGESLEYTRVTEVGNRFTTGFCPECGGTVWCRGELKPGVIGVPVGAFGDPNFPAPVRSVWEQTKHAWVELPDGLQHFLRGRGG